MLLALVVLRVTFVQTFASAERTRNIRAKRVGAWSNLLAFLLGNFTPFCSCSAVPLFIGFVRAGVPLGATFSFPVSAPMVNVVALFMPLGLFGWKIAGLCAVTGVSIAFVSGWILGKLRMERHLESWVIEIPCSVQAASDDRMGFKERLDAAVQGVMEIVGKVWPYILAGIAVGAFIHGYVPEALMARFMGKGAWWSVPPAVVIDVVATGILVVDYLFNFILQEDPCQSSKSEAPAAPAARSLRNGLTRLRKASASNTPS